MSRTDKTAPLRVRMAHGDVASEPFHRHTERGVECDLPDRPDPHWGNYLGQTCYWHFSYTGVNVCGCPMCTGQDERRLTRRRERRAARLESRRTRTSV